MSEEKKTNIFAEKIVKLIDVKSITTISLIGTLVFIIVSGRNINSDAFLLFSNCTTAVITYFFTKPKKEGE